MEISARIHFPLSLAGKTAKWNVAMNEWDASIINEHCEGTYLYRNGTTPNDYYVIKDVKKKVVSKLTSPLLLIPPKTGESEQQCLDTSLVDKELQGAIDIDTTGKSHTYLNSEIIVKTFNDYAVTCDNWEDVASLRCKCCKAEFDFDTTEDSFISEKLRSGEISYTYICATCLTEIRNRQPKESKEDNKIIHLDNMRTSIRTAN